MANVAVLDKLVPTARARKTIMAWNRPGTRTWFTAAGDQVKDVHRTKAEKQATRDKMLAKGNRP
jgi:hypothetical protein